MPDLGDRDIGDRDIGISGRVLALMRAPAYGAPLEECDELTMIAGVGVRGDRHAGKLRQVTVVSTGELAVAAAEMGVTTLDPVATRRNTVVDVEVLPRTHGTVFTIGDVEFAVWRDCAPCAVMDEAFGRGAKEALQQRCGISATVTKGGVVRIGDVVALPDPTLR